MNKDLSYSSSCNFNLADTTPGAYFSANADISKIQIDKLDPSDFQSKIKISWNCSYCDYVYIEGLDSLQRSNSGEIEIDDKSFGYTIIGVSGSSISAKTVNGSIIFKPGPGIDGRIFSLKNERISMVLKKSWQYPFKSPKPLQMLEPVIISVLQSFQYISEASKPDSNSLLFECEPFQSNPLVCLGEDCNLKTGKRKIERKMSIEAAIQKNGNDYLLFIKPTIMRNFRKQDDNWSPDPQTLEASKNACDEIAKKIVQSL